MSVKADGTLLIETGIDLDGFRTDCEKLQKSAKNAASSISAIEKNLKSVMQQLTSLSAETGSHADAAQQKAKRVGKEAEGAAKGAKKAAAEAKKAQKELANIRDQEITITRMEETPEYDDDDLPQEIEVNPRSLGYSREAMKAIGLGAQEAKQHVNRLAAEIERTEETLKELEAEGKWFGDADYDEAYQDLKILNQDVREYREQLEIASRINPFDLDSFAGKIREAEQELAQLSSAGKGLGNEEFDKAYRKLALLKEEAKEYAKELSKTPAQVRKEEEQIAALNQKLEETRAKEVQAAMEADRLKAIGENAKVSNQSVVNLNCKLSQLKERQRELENAGVGLGYSEYDRNAAKIAKLEERLKKYEDAVTGAKKRTKSFEHVISSATSRISRLAGVVSGAAGKLVKGAGSGVKAIAGINRQTKSTQMSLGKMLGTSLLFSTVFRAISAVTNGIGQGFQNLTMYSDETNASLSALLSAMTRLKNSIATAFSPILTVAAPILVTFINLLSKALTYVGMFFAALTGQSSFVKAVGVQQDYRETLAGTAGSADDAADATNNLADATEKAEKANESYLSGLDEIRRWENPNQDNTSGGGSSSAPSAGDGAISPGDMFETVSIENSIKGLADKIKKLLKAEDWEGLGKFVADGVNKGLQKIYDVISWDNVGPKITKFVRAFTETFNSLVKYMDFDLLGRTIGAGINTLVKAFNLLIGPGGIDFAQIGRKLSQGLRGAIGEINWTELGNLLGNYFMVSWKMLDGFVTDMSRRNGAGLTGWQELGQALAQAANGAFEKINFTRIGLTLTNGINGIFSSLRSFAETVHWEELAHSVSNGLNAAFYNLDWAEAGRSLNIFIGKLVGFLVQLLKETDWEAFGRGVGEFLGEVDWKGHLWSMAKAIAKAIGELFEGLEQSGTAGKVVAFLTKVFLAVKIADITGIGTLVAKLIAKIGAKLISKEGITAVAGKLSILFSKGTSEAGDLLKDLGEAAEGSSGGFMALAKSIAPLVGAAGLIVGIGAAFVVAVQGLSNWIETLQGGNGVTTEAGSAIKGYIQSLAESGLITANQAKELFLLSEEMESAGTSAEESYANIASKMQEYGVTADQAEYAVSKLNQTQHATAESVEGLAEATKGLGNETTNMADQIDLSSMKSEEAYDRLKEAVGKVSNSSSEASQNMGNLLQAMENSVGPSTTAQDVFNNVMEKAKDLGLNTETVAKIFAEVFPEAVQTAAKETGKSTKEIKDSVDTNIVGATNTIESHAESAEKTVSETMSGMRSDAEENLSNIQETAESAFGAVDDTTVLNWGNSAREVSLNLREMKLAASTELANMVKTVTSYSESMYNIMTKKWEYMATRVGQLITGMNSTEVEPKLRRTVDIIGNCWQQAADRTSQVWSQISRTVSESIANLGYNIRSQMNSVIGTVNSGISNINYSISGIESAMNFGPWEVPTATGSRTIGFRASFPRVSRVPYLATGAVIPPRSEFLAVLGDQKHGNNIEAPEGLLRKIVREESGGKQAGGTYRFVAQMNRRTFFDEMIEEAKLRRDLNGANPFSLS